MFSEPADQKLMIVPISGYPPQIGRLLGILTYVREGTLRVVSPLTREQLGARADDTSNSIGELLGQIELEERLFQVRAFEGRNPTDQERKDWASEPAPESPGGSTARSLEDHLERLAQLREQTLTHFYRLPDAWLDEIHEIPGGITVNRYWHLFQLAEEEIRHREHIRWLLGRAAD